MQSFRKLDLKLSNSGSMLPGILVLLIVIGVLLPSMMQLHSGTFRQTISIAQKKEEQDILRYLSLTVDCPVTLEQMPNSCREQYFYLKNKHNTDIVIPGNVKKYVLSATCDDATADPVVFRLEVKNPMGDTKRLSSNSLFSCSRTLQ